MGIKNRSRIREQQKGSKAPTARAASCAVLEKPQVPRERELRECEDHTQLTPAELEEPAAPILSDQHRLATAAWTGPWEGPYRLSRKERSGRGVTGKRESSDQSPTSRTGAP